MLSTGDTELVLVSISSTGDYRTSDSIPQLETRGRNSGFSVSLGVLIVPLKCHISSRVSSSLKLRYLESCYSSSYHSNFKKKILNDESQVLYPMKFQRMKMWLRDD